jgi:hypothetical protein
MILGRTVRRTEVSGACQLYLDGLSEGLECLELVNDTWTDRPKDWGVWRLSMIPGRTVRRTGVSVACQ